MANYGRMDPDKPAPTLTTGYATPGRGRFIHPTKPRTLLPREAARIQGFPDWFSFQAGDEQPPRASLNTWLGNAVPSILGFVAVAALPPMRPRTRIARLFGRLPRSSGLSRKTIATST